jgi:hypothetical protein
MNKETPYLTQYCNLCFEWRSLGINVENASKSQMLAMQSLRDNAMQQSGLTLSELAIVRMCREYKISQQLKIYARRFKSI